MTENMLLCTRMRVPLDVTYRGTQMNGSTYKAKGTILLKDMMD